MLNRVFTVRKLQSKMKLELMNESKQNNALMVNFYLRFLKKNK